MRNRPIDHVWAGHRLASVFRSGNQPPSVSLSLAATRSVPTARHWCSDGCSISGMGFLDTLTRPMNVERGGNRTHTSCYACTSLCQARSSQSSNRIQGLRRVITARMPNLQPLPEPHTPPLSLCPRLLPPQTSSLKWGPFG